MKLSDFRVGRDVECVVCERKDVLTAHVGHPAVNGVCLCADCLVDLANEVAFSSDPPHAELQDSAG